MDRQRVQKLLELRQKELDNKVRSLAEERTSAEAAGVAVELAATQLRLAADRRVQLNRAGADWQTWVETQDWMSQKARLFAQAQLFQTQCVRRVEHALAAVHKARSDVLRIEALIARLDAEQKRQEARAERRREDEFQTNQAASRQPAVR